MTLHHVAPEAIAEARAHGLDFARAACGRVPVPDELTCDPSQVTCPGCQTALGLAKTTPETPWMTVFEAALHFRISERLFRDMLRRGDLDGAVIHQGRLWRIHRERAEAVLLGITPGESHGLAVEDEPSEPRDKTEGDVLHDLLERREQPHPVQGHRVRAREGSAQAAQDRRAPPRRRTPGGAAAYRAFLTEDT